MGFGASELDRYRDIPARRANALRECHQRRPLFLLGRSAVRRQRQDEAADNGQQRQKRAAFHR